MNSLYKLSFLKTSIKFLGPRHLLRKVDHHPASQIHSNTNLGDSSQPAIKRPSVVGASLT